MSPRKAIWLHEATDHSVPPNRRHAHVHFSDLGNLDGWPVIGVAVREPWRLKHLFGHRRVLHAFGSDPATGELVYLGESPAMAGACQLINQYEEGLRRA